MLKKFYVGYSIETNQYFVRALYTHMVSTDKAYPVEPTEREKCIEKLRTLMKKHPNIPVLHDGLCGTQDTHQECMKLIIEAFNPNERADFYNDELLEFYNKDFQFIIGRHALSKAMIANEDERTVDALISDYYEDHEEAFYIFDILSDADICMNRELDLSLIKGKIGLDKKIKEAAQKKECLDSRPEKEKILYNKKNGIEK